MSEALQESSPEMQAAMLEEIGQPSKSDALDALEEASSRGHAWCNCCPSAGSELTEASLQRMIDQLKRHNGKISIKPTKVWYPDGKGWRSL